VFLQLREYMQKWAAPTKKQERGRKGITVIQPTKKATLPAESPDQRASYKLASKCKLWFEIHPVPKVSQVDNEG
jgi:hypothetical protein